MTEEEKKGNGLLIFAIVAAIIVIAAIIIGSIYLMDYSKEEQVKFKSNSEKGCIAECEKFNFTYYKIDNEGWRWEACWCIDDMGKPKSIGALP